MIDRVLFNVAPTNILKSEWEPFLVSDADTETFGFTGICNLDAIVAMRNIIMRSIASTSTSSAIPASFQPYVESKNLCLVLKSLYLN